LGFAKEKLIGLKSGSRFEAGSELLVKQESGSEGDAGSAFFGLIKEILRRSMSLRTEEHFKRKEKGKSCWLKLAHVAVAARIIVYGSSYRLGILVDSRGGLDLITQP
jgi:hypothetical protein